MTAAIATTMTPEQRVAKFESLMVDGTPLPDSHYFNLGGCILQISKIDGGTAQYAVYVYPAARTEPSRAYYYDAEGTMTAVSKGSGLTNKTAIARSPDTLIAQASALNERPGLVSEIQSRLNPSI